MLEAVRKRMKEKSMSQQDLSELTGIERPNVTRLLTGRSGKVPENWQKILDILGLEITVKEKDPEQ